MVPIMSRLLFDHPLLMALALALAIVVAMPWGELGRAMAGTGETPCPHGERQPGCGS